MTETVIAPDLPDELAGTYETEGVWNLINNRFVEEGPDRTRWIAETEFRFSDWKMLLMSIVMWFALTGQTKKAPNDFKTFAEGEGRGTQQPSATAGSMGERRLLVGIYKTQSPKDAVGRLVSGGGFNVPQRQLWVARVLPLEPPIAGAPQDDCRRCGRSRKDIVLCELIVVARVA